MASQEELLSNESNSQSRTPELAGLPGYWTPRELALKLNISQRTLARWHAERIAPPRVSINRKSYYRIESVEQFLRSREDRPCRTAARGRR
jgi:hypothetical protein